MSDKIVALDEELEHAKTKSDSIANELNAVRKDSSVGSISLALFYYPSGSTRNLVGLVGMMKWRTDRQRGIEQALSLVVRVARILSASHSAKYQWVEPACILNFDRI